MIFTTGYDRDVLPEAFRDRPRIEKPFDMNRLIALMQRGGAAHAL